MLTCLKITFLLFLEDIYCVYGYRHQRLKVDGLFPSMTARRRSEEVSK